MLVPKLALPFLLMTAIVDEEEKEQVRQAVQRLNGQDQEVLSSLYFDDHSLKEIERLLERPLGTIKSRLNAALRRAKTELRSMGLGTDEDVPYPRKERKTADSSCRVTFPLPAVTSLLVWAG
jgi:hypothetical protein